MKNPLLKTLLIGALHISSVSVCMGQDEPFYSFYSDYTGDSFTAMWNELSGATNYRLSVFGHGESKTIDETFAGINHTNGKINLDNPNFPAGWDINVSANGSADIAFDGERDRVLLDATNDYISSGTIIGSNVSDIIVNAHIVNADGLTKENSTIFVIDIYDKEDNRITGGQIEAMYFASNVDFVLSEALGYNPANVGSFKISISKEEGHDVGDLLISSISYTYDAPQYVVEKLNTAETSYEVKDLDAEQEYFFYVEADVEGGKSVVSNVARVNEFLTPTATKATNISTTSYTANWKKLPKAKGYIVQNYEFQTAQEDGEQAIMAENFDKATEGTMDEPVSITDTKPYTDYKEWTGGNMLVANGMLGADNGRFPMSMAYLQSPEMDLSAEGGKYKIHLKAYGIPGDYLSVYRVDYLIDSDGDGNPDALNIHKVTSFDENGYAEETWEMEDGASAMKLSFEENRMKRFFIDEISITQEVKAGTVTKFILEKAEIKDGSTTSYTFEGLKENHEYGYEVTGMRYDDYGYEEYSGVSELCMVPLLTDGIEDATVEGPSLHFAGNTATLTLGKEALIQLFSIDGKLLKSMKGTEGKNSIRIDQSGTYLLKAGNKTYKVIAR